MLLYGAEIWGVEKQIAIERVHYYACKRYMCVQTNSCNDAVLGDCGRFPLYIKGVKRSISYWLKLLKMRETKYARQCYNMLFHFDQLGYTNWATSIRKLLYNNGFGYLWELQEVNNEKRFLYALQQTIKDQFLQTWYTEVFSNSKLNWYSESKTEFTHEPYLNVVKVRKY